MEKKSSSKSANDQRNSAGIAAFFPNTFPAFISLQPLAGL